MLDHRHVRSNWSPQCVPFHTENILFDLFPHLISISLHLTRSLLFIRVEADDLNERRFIVANINFFFSHIKMCPGVDYRRGSLIIFFLTTNFVSNTASIYKVIYSISKPKIFLSLSTIDRTKSALNLMISRERAKKLQLIIDYESCC